jgi:hypothetical protein
MNRSAYHKAYDKARRLTDPEYVEKRRADARAWKSRNKEKVRAYRAAWYAKNKEAEGLKSKEYLAQRPGLKSAYDKAHRERHAEKIVARRRSLEGKLIRRKWENDRRLNDTPFRLRTNLGVAIRQAIRLQRAGSKTKSTEALLGCTVAALIQYLEERFLPGMSWGNYGLRGWHIDHIKPSALFDLSKEEERLACFHYTNLQPLWARDNIVKGKKYAPQAEQPETAIA